MSIINLKYLIDSFIKEKIYDFVEPFKLSTLRKKHDLKYKSLTNDLVTIYTPTYNRSELLINRAIPSALEQTYKNFEYIIVGDCCTDNTEEEVRKNFTDKRIKFINLKKRKKNYPNILKNNWLAGAVLPSNHAFKISKGDWIARLDDDEVWEKDHLKNLLLHAKENNYEFVSGNVENIINGQKIETRGNRVFSDYFKTLNLNIDEDKSNPYIGGISTWLIRSYIMKNFKFNESCWKKKYNSDHGIEFAVRLIKAGSRIGHLDKIVTFQHPRPGEESVGWEAYSSDEENKSSHYKIIK
jgi:glycosyltransferase involved in cell wall biosynthesis